jgi:hypothetical protein
VRGGWDGVTFVFFFLIDVFDVWYSIALRACMVFGAGKSLWCFGDMGSFRASRSFHFWREDGWASRC